jgi:hypothetical protein
MIGKLPDDVLNALLETLPVEFSVLDANDRVVHLPTEWVNNRPLG